MNTKLNYDAPRTEMVKLWFEGKFLSSPVETMNEKKGYWGAAPDPEES